MTTYVCVQEGRWAEECSGLGEKDDEFCAVIETCAEQLPALSHGGVVKAGAQSHPRVPPYQSLSDSQPVLLGPAFKMSLSD